MTGRRAQWEGGQREMPSNITVLSKKKVLWSRPPEELQGKLVLKPGFTDPQHSGACEGTLEGIKHA